MKTARIILAIFLAVMCIPAFRAGDWWVGLILVAVAYLAWPKGDKPAHKVATRLHK